MSKITIKHYLNKKLKPVDFGKDNMLYPIYARILIGRDVQRIKSPLFDNNNKIFDYQSDANFESKEIQNKLKNESRLINFVFENGEKFKDCNLNFLIKTLDYSIIELLKIDFTITYFETYKNGIEKHFFECLNNELSIYLETKTKINKNYFLQNIKIDNIRDYKYLEKIDFIKFSELEIYFKIAMYFVEFELKKYTSAKPLNIYEWYYNNGKEKFLSFISDEKLLNEITKFCLEIDSSCKIRLELTE